MKSIAVTTLVASATLAVSVFAAEPAPEKVVALVHAKVEGLASDAVFIEAVHSQNARKATLDDIQQLDEKWRSTPGIAPYMTELMDSACGERLKSLKAGQRYFSEMFVVDNQGANVCMSDKTSDYWQGDESKFTKSFTGGTGTVFVDDVKFDDSTQTYVVQASVPVVDGGKAIGVLVVSVDVDMALALGK